MKKREKLPLQQLCCCSCTVTPTEGQFHQICIASKILKYVQKRTCNFFRKFKKEQTSKHEMTDTLIKHQSNKRNCPDVYTFFNALWATAAAGNQHVRCCYYSKKARLLSLYVWVILVFHFCFNWSCVFISTRPILPALPYVIKHTENFPP